MVSGTTETCNGQSCQCRVLLGKEDMWLKHRDNKWQILRVLSAIRVETRCQPRQQWCNPCKARSWMFFRTQNDRVKKRISTGYPGLFRIIKQVRATLSLCEHSCEEPGLAQYGHCSTRHWHDEQEAETQLGQKEQGYVAPAEPGWKQEKYPPGNSPPLHPVWLLERQMSSPAGSACYLQSKGSTKAVSGFGQAGISPICLCRTCLSLGQQRSL